MQHYLATGEGPVLNRIIEITALHRDGHEFPVELTIVPIPDGDRVAFSGFVRDISERKSLESQLQQSQKMEAFGQLAGGVAHDFNNLLTVILGFSEMLLMEVPQQDSMWSSLKAIGDAGERAAGLTRQLLAFSRQSVLELKVLDLNATVEETGKMLRRVIGEDILLAMVLHPKLRWMKADPGQLGQLLMNLAVNARDAMPKGGRLTIQTGNVVLDQNYAKRHSEVVPGPHIMLTISDTGVGMTPEVLSRIFEPFFTTKDVGKGTGLGMAVVHGIVKQNGGSIEVSSEPGVGTVFKLYFSAMDEEVAKLSSHHSEKAYRGTETVLLVEDEDNVRGLAILILQARGYTVFAASDGKEGLRIAENQKKPFDLLITDVVMPKMGGHELAELLRPRFPRMKMLFVSGYTDDAMIRHGILHDEVAFLQKPFSPLTLAKKVREVLDAGETRRQETL